MSNEQRRMRAEAAMTAYQAVYATPDASYEETITDLIADLLHFAASEDLKPDEMISMALMHFEAESNEEADDDEDQESDGDHAFNVNGVCTVCGMKDKRG